MRSLEYFQKYLIFVFLFSIQANTISSQKFLSKGELSAPSQILDVKRERPWRLPNTTYPLEYHLHITTWIHQEINKFLGHVSIELLVKESTSELVLHAVGLEISKLSVKDLTSKQEIESLIWRIIDDLLVIDRNNGNKGTTKDFVADIFVKNHRLRLEIDYSGIINDPPRGKKGGFSMMTYKDEKNKTIYGAYTDMEPTHAREVLPCYDEPALKANFSVRITHGSNYTAISNMPAISSVENGTNQMTTTSFMKTPPMSSYLLAFVISNLKSIERKSEGILQRVFLSPNSKINGALVLKKTTKVTQLLTQYMDVPYSLPKLDHVFIKQFYGAMENWGLITYNLLPFSGFGLSVEDAWNTITLYHEIVHQWLGNLVSPAWWDSTWLSEGFAVYYAHVFYKMTSLKNENKTFKKAYFRCTTPKHYKKLVSVIEYTEISGYIRPKNMAFGAYEKSPCIIQMFHHAFGEPIFRKGISNYLKSRAFSTVNETHLYDNLHNALLESTQGTWNYSVHEIMSSWLHAKSIPIVTITRDYENSNIIHIRQRASQDSVMELWWIPLNFATTSHQNLNNTEAVYYMPPVPAVTLNLAELNITLRSEDWLVADIQCTGYYRLEYDEKNVRKLQKLLKKNPSFCCQLNCDHSSAKIAELINQS